MKANPTPYDIPIAPRKLKLLVTVVNREKAEFYMDVLQDFEVNFQTSMAARGTASKETLRLLGIGESDKTVIFSVIREDRVKKALDALATRFSTVKGGKGIAYTVPMSGMIGVSLYQFLSNNRRSGKEGS